MPSTLDGTRSDTVHFCDCGKHSAYHCRIRGDSHIYCEKRMAPRKPKWIVDAERRSAARKRYYLKRYGSLSRMHDIDEKRQQDIDDTVFKDEITNPGG